MSTGLNDREKRARQVLKLQEELLAVEEDFAAGRMGCTPDELAVYLDDIIDRVEKQGKRI